MIRIRLRAYCTMQLVMVKIFLHNKLQIGCTYFITPCED